MKIAYLGYDRSCLRTFSTLNSISTDNQDIIYFLKEKNQDHQFKVFEKTNLLSNQLMISYDTEKRTQAQKNEFVLFENNYKTLQQQIGAKSLDSKDSKTLDVSASFPEEAKILDLSEIVDIQFDSSRKKIVIELDKKGIESFDILLTESHSLLANFFEQKKIRIFSKVPAINYTWSSFQFEFEVRKPISAVQTGQPFFVITDSTRDSIIDNWFYCQLKDSMIQIWSFQPTNQIYNPEFENFYIDRIRQAVSSALPFLLLKNYLKSQFSTVSMIAEEKMAKPILGSSVVVQNFSFWNDYQMEIYLQRKLYKIVNKIKKNNEANP